MRPEVPAIRFECPDCEIVVVNAATCPRCGYSHFRQRPTPEPMAEGMWQQKNSGPPPCTPEQNAEAGRIVRAVLNRTMTPEEGNRAIAALFGDQPPA